MPLHVPASLASSVHSGTHTVTHTVLLNPVTTASVSNSAPIVFYAPLTIGINENAVWPNEKGYSTTDEATTTSLPRSIVPSDLKASMSIPTTLVTDTNAHEDPASTEDDLMSTLPTFTFTDPTEDSVTATETPESTSTDDDGSSSTMFASDDPTSTSSSTTRTLITTLGTQRVPTTSTPTSISAAPEPRAGLNKLSIALLGLWGVACVAAWL